MKKKLLIVNDLYNGGGVEKLLQMFLQEWTAKYDISVMLNTLEGSDSFRKGVKRYLVNPSVPRTDFCSRGAQKGLCKPYIVYSMKKLMSFLHLLRRYDAVLCMKEGKLQLCASHCRAKRKVGLVHTEFTNCHYSGMDFKIADQDEKSCMRKYDSIVCVSERVKRGILDTIGDPGNLIVQYNPIDIESIRAKAKEKSLLLQEKDPEKTRFVMIGDICDQKGYDILIDALAILDQSGYADKYEVFIAGRSENNRGNQVSINLDENPAITALGFADNPYPIIAAADWFLSTSRWEGYSLSAQEAIALGTPVMLTDCAGVDELIADSEYGIRMQIDAKDIASHMMRVIDDPALHEHYKTKAAERISALGSYNERIRNMEKLLGLE